MMIRRYPTKKSDFADPTKKQPRASLTLGGLAVFFVEKLHEIHDL
jgi:hypothetical protein